ncbi:hypothetical protein [Pseudoalteromonas ardens]|uniref:Uncharacterized protein n=1 Tax=Pseudoalteromonas rubra TaxID=43658 RepID=A0A0L0EZA6_9GAMM|nr:hypothetical protein [Pseudoalteromonas sp. R96]KNC69158.1 hypothetical protein AC626_00760 [Pseudoalteromonas rubra]MDK1312642.1 hypothetical protein [Pseudoalteromonas sp. R96]
MKEVYAIMEYAPLFVICLGLAISWNIATARWFLLAYGVFEIIDLVTLPITLQWSTHYYLADIGMSLIFVIPIVYRRNLALRLYVLSGSQYFKRVYRLQTLSAQECTILLLIALMCLANLITWLEVLAYKYYIIDSAPFKLYIRDNFMLLLHIVLCFTMFAFAMSAQVREKYAEQESVH